MHELIEQSADYINVITSEQSKTKQRLQHVMPLHSTDKSSPHLRFTTHLLLLQVDARLPLYFYHVRLFFTCPTVAKIYSILVYLLLSLRMLVQFRPWQQQQLQLRIAPAA